MTSRSQIIPNSTEAPSEAKVRIAKSPPRCWVEKVKTFRTRPCRTSHITNPSLDMCQKDKNKMAVVARASKLSSTEDLTCMWLNHSVETDIADHVPNQTRAKEHSCCESNLTRRGSAISSRLKVVKYTRCSYGKVHVGSSTAYESPVEHKKKSPLAISTVFLTFTTPKTSLWDARIMNLPELVPQQLHRH